VKLKDLLRQIESILLPRYDIEFLYIKDKPNARPEYLILIKLHNWVVVDKCVLMAHFLNTLLDGHCIKIESPQRLALKLSKEFWNKKFEEALSKSNLLNLEVWVSFDDFYNYLSERAEDYKKPLEYSPQAHLEFWDRVLLFFYSPEIDSLYHTLIKNFDDYIRRKLLKLALDEDQFDVDIAVSKNYDTLLYYGYSYYSFGRFPADGVAPLISFLSLNFQNPKVDIKEVWNKFLEKLDDYGFFEPIKEYFPRLVSGIKQRNDFEELNLIPPSYYLLESF